MRIAVLSLTRDRLAYTQHCFASLREHAGCHYDHYVLDQGSDDGTGDWLLDEADVDSVCCLDENVGIARGMNVLLSLVIEDGPYDVIVKYDNDCELTQPHTLRDIANLVLHDGRTLLSPRILGLNNPPPVQGTFAIDGEPCQDIPQIGGIFTAAPGIVYEAFRHDEESRLHSPEDVDLCWWWRGQGGRCGYVTRLEANHYETTSGQHARYPAYFERTLAEGKPSL